MIIQVIYNPNSGGGRGGKLAPLIIQSLGQHGNMTIDHCTLYRNHATEIAKHIDMGRCDAMVVIGGDGTMYEVLNGLMANTTSQKRPPLGMIPVGTGNSFAKDLNMFHWKDGILAVMKGKTRRADIMKFITEGEAYYSMNSIGFGIPADVSIRGNKYKKFLGKWAYTACAVTEIMRFKPHETRLEVDGKVHEFEGAFTNFSNSVYFGGNMKISPDSVIDDGIIEAVVLENMSKGELLHALPSVYSGEHLSNPHVKVYKGKHFKVETVPTKICNPEGEIFGVTPLEITVLPKEIEFFVKPEKKADRKKKTGSPKKAAQRSEKNTAESKKTGTSSATTAAEAKKPSPKAGRPVKAPAKKTTSTPPTASSGKKSGTATNKKAGKEKDTPKKPAAKKPLPKKLLPKKQQTQKSPLRRKQRHPHQGKPGVRSKIGSSKQEIVRRKKEI
ncbi:MAG: YegS/Rv2252/BmrU family lipid kinase [Candidatus Marinimicrobia bacterium]|nr:YegS/Rv2252/BmrU family lipid kinase [Candidatus Neomarinimicrobiota bacterium]